jgi:hypothetical protein
VAQVLVLVLTMAACGGPVAQAEPDPGPLAGSPAGLSPKPSSTLKKTVKAGVKPPRTGPSAAVNDGVPMHSARTFSVAAGGSDVRGSGTVLVKYRVEVEDGIAWGSNPVWTPAAPAPEA